MTIKRIHQETVLKYGVVAMINKSIQEFNELIEELRDNKNGAKNHDHIQEEIADCRNMLDKLECIYTLDHEETKKIQFKKMHRTMERLNDN